MPLATQVFSLADDYVTFAKIQNIDTNRMLGRGSAGAGDIEQMVLSSDYGLTFTYAASSLKINTPQDLQTAASPTFAGITISTNGKAYFRDSALYIYSANDGYLDLVADTDVRVKTYPVRPIPVDAIYINTTGTDPATELGYGTWVEETSIGLTVWELTIGDGTDNVDFRMIFDGGTNDCLITWMEDEDYLQFSDDILLATTEKIQFRDTAIYIYSANDGYLDIVADTGIRLSPVLTVTYGGTGAAALADHGVLLGSGTGAITPTAVGATGEYLAGSTGADPGWATLNQAAVAGLTTASSPVFVTVKLSNLTDGYVPYHVADATGLADSILVVNSTTLTIGTGAAGVDYILTFNGENNDGIITWMEDEDYFKFSDDLLVDSTEKVQFRDTAIYINSTDDGYLDLVADTGIRLKNSVSIGTADDVPGVLDILSGGNTEAGGCLKVELPPDQDGAIAYYAFQVAAATDDLIIGPDTDLDVLMLVANSSNICTVNTTTLFRAMANNSATKYPTSGKGIEVYYDTNSSDAGYIITYDRDASAWKPLTLWASCVGINTATAPVGGVGYACLAIDGLDGSVYGPHVQFTTNANDYPLRQILPWQHDNLWDCFDCYFDGSWRSSDADSNFILGKYQDHLQYWSAMGHAAGAVITWGTALTISKSGKVGVRCTTDIAALEVEDGGTGAGIITKITQDDATVYGLIIGNDTYSTTDTTGLALYVQNDGTGIINSAVALSLNYGTAISVGIATGSPRARLEVLDYGTPKSVVMAMVQDNDDVYGITVVNKTYSDNVIHGLIIDVLNAGTGRIISSASDGTWGNLYIYAETHLKSALANVLTIGNGTAGIDYYVTFDGETNDGVITWKEDEDYFEFSDDLLLATTEKIQFRDTAIYIASNDDGHLDLMADVSIDLNTGADTDLVVNFFGTTNAGVLTWMEDEDYFQFADDIFIGTEKLYFNGTDTSLYESGDDIHLDTPANKTLVLDEVVYEDIRVSSGNIDRPGLDDPTWVSVTPGGGAITTRLLEFAVDDVGTFTVQIPHCYKTGQDIKVHLHWTPGTRGNEENGKLVGWKIDYTWANINGAFGAMATADLSDACNGVDWEHNMTPEATLDGHTVAKGISSMLVCNVKRTDTGADDDWASSTSGQLPLLLEVDFHFPIDTIGSRDWGTK